jgi:type IX secretion system PorP/SprF family membrane protein
MNGYRHVAFILIFLSNTVLAQQDPVNSQYMSNPLAYNPSYSGINNVANVTLNSRFQWSSLDGSPTTYIFSANSSVVDGKVGLGLMVLSDKIGVSENTEVQISYAYKISSSTSTFSFGLQTGMVSYKNNFDNLNLRVNNDPLFQTGVDKATKFNVGAGATYMTDNLFVSLSVPRLINSKVVGAGAEVLAYERHYYLVGAYLWDIKPGFKMKPSVLLRAVAGAPLSYDINVNFYINNKFWAGVYTRSLNTLGILAQFDFLDAYKIGYSYEILSNDLTARFLPTHEIILSADLALFSHQSIYKRFF